MLTAISILIISTLVYAIVLTAFGNFATIERNWGRRTLILLSLPCVVFLVTVFAICAGLAEGWDEFRDCLVSAFEEIQEVWDGD